MNPGNSGGPLLDMEGHVVAVATFIDQGDFGPGISGAITLDKLWRLLDGLGIAPDTLEAPSPDRLSVLPSGSYPFDALMDAAESMKDAAIYSDFLAMDAGHFTISVETPLYNVVLINELEREIGRERRKREQRADLPEELRYTGVFQNRDWSEHIGGPSRPARTLRSSTWI